MRARIKIEFCDEDPVVIVHESTIILSVNEALEADIRAGRIPNLQMAILPAGSQQHIGGRIINLDEIYGYGREPDAQQDGWNVFREAGVFPVETPIERAEREQDEAIARSRAYAPYGTHAEGGFKEIPIPGYPARKIEGLPEGLNWSRREEPEE